MFTIVFSPLDVLLTVPNGTYRNIGAVADLYKNGTYAGHHFFDEAGRPTWVLLDPPGDNWTFRGVVTAMAPTQNQQNDGGFGSVDSLLLQMTDGSGMFLAKSVVTCFFSSINSPE